MDIILIKRTIFRRKSNRDWSFIWKPSTGYYKRRFPSRRWRKFYRTFEQNLTDLFYFGLREICCCKNVQIFLKEIQYENISPRNTETLYSNKCITKKHTQIKEIHPKQLINVTRYKNIFHKLLTNCYKQTFLCQRSWFIVADDTIKFNEQTTKFNDISPAPT